MAKKLITLISTKGKSMKQVQEEAIAAMQKFRKIHSESLANNPQESKPALTIEELNKQIEKEGRLISEPPQGLQVIFGAKGPQQKKKNLSETPVTTAKETLPEGYSKPSSRIKDVTQPGMITQITPFNIYPRRKPTEKQPQK